MNELNDISLIKWVVGLVVASYIWLWNQYRHLSKKIYDSEKNCSKKFNVLNENYHQFEKDCFNNFSTKEDNKVITSSLESIRTHIDNRFDSIRDLIIEKR